MQLRLFSFVSRPPTIARLFSPSVAEQPTAAAVNHVIRAVVRYRDTTAVPGASLSLG